MLKSKLWLWKYCRRRFLTWPHFGISSTDPNGRPTLYSIISSTIGKLAFEWSNLRILSTDSKIVPQESIAQLLSFEWSRHRLFFSRGDLVMWFSPVSFQACSSLSLFVCFLLFVSSEKLLRPFSLPKSQKKAQKDSQRDQNPAKTWRS